MLGAFEAEHVGHNSHPRCDGLPGRAGDRRAGRARRAELPGGDAARLRSHLPGSVRPRRGPTESERGFHNPGVNGAFGSAAAVGKLLGFDAERLASALGVAGSHACGLTEFVWVGAMTKRAHPRAGRPIRPGERPAGARGFSGPTTVLEGQYGFLNAYSPAPRPERLVDRLGQEWLCAALVTKALPLPQPPASRSSMRSSDQAGAEDRAGADRMGGAERQPRTRRAAPPRPDPDHAARRPYSLPFTTACGPGPRPGRPLWLDESTLADPGHSAPWPCVSRSVRTRRASAPTAPRRGVLELDGVSYTLAADGFPGSARRPLDFDGAADKFSALRRAADRRAASGRAGGAGARDRAAGRTLDPGANDPGPDGRPGSAAILAVLCWAARMAALPGTLLSSDSPNDAGEAPGARSRSAPARPGR